MTPYESVLRDLLADRLELLEPGLTLVTTECTVANPGAGAGGRIDILARDQFGNTVAIELKRSDNAARAALNEVMKYVALLQTERGLPAEKLRVFLVSTSWHELQTPFSEQVHTSPYSLQGYHLELDGDGVPSRATPVQPLPPSAGLAFPDELPWLVFSSADDRTQSADEIKGILNCVGVSDAVLLEFSSHDRERVQFPHSLILALPPLRGDEARHVLTQKAYEVPLLADFGPMEELQEADGSLRDAAESSLLSRLYCPPVREVHHVEGQTLLAELKDWKLEAVHRVGARFSNPDLWTDRDIVEALCGTDGSNDTYLQKTVPCSAKAQLAALRMELQRFCGRYGWESAVVPALERAAPLPDAKLSARVYAPVNLLRHLAMFLQTGNAGYLPHFEMTVSSSSGTEHLVGFMGWDGVTEAPPPDKVLPDRGVGSNILRLIVDDPNASDDLVQAYGFVFPVFRGINEGAPDGDACAPMQTWLQKNQERAAELGNRLGRITV